MRCSWSVARTLRVVASSGLFALALSTMPGSARAVGAFTETFDTNASNWLNVASTAPTWNATGGVGNSGYISYSQSFTSGGSGPFGSPPLQLYFRGNDANNASGDAFVGNWIASGIQSMSVAVRHNYGSALSLYARLDGGAGQAASLASVYTIPAGSAWTTITIPITDANPPFLSYGAGTFASVFDGILNLQLGLYVPPGTSFTDLRMDLDNVAIPEPTSLSLIGLGLGALLVGRRRAAH